MPVLKTTCKVNCHVGNGELLFGQFIILKAKEKKAAKIVAEGQAQPTKATPIMSQEKDGKTAGPPIFQGQPTALIPFLLLAAGPTATCGRAFFFPFFF